MVEVLEEEFPTTHLMPQWLVPGFSLAIFLQRIHECPRSSWRTISASLDGYWVNRVVKIIPAKLMMMFDLKMMHMTCVIFLIAQAFQFSKGLGSFSMPTK